MQTPDELTPEEQQTAQRLLDEWRPWLEATARREAQRQHGRLLVVSTMRHTPPGFFTENVEDRYRRGFHQGYSRALDDVPERLHRAPWWQSLARFYDRELYRWRATDHRGRMTLPPPLTEATAEEMQP